MQQTTRNCPECGTPLSEYWPQGLCAQCAFDGVLEEPGESCRRFGNYELIEEIGRGGMGIVYRAQQLGLNRMVALKMLLGGQFASKQEVLRFRSEAEAAANLHHRNIVGIHETGERDGQHYFSMEYIEGRTLAETVRDGPLPAQRAARYTQLIAEAIAYAHEQGVLHRDLKPSNVLIDADDQPRITDFGLAKRVRGDFGLTVSGQVLGSPNFMPPEQIAGRSRPVGPTSDVYGIGALFYHLLTARPPFQAENLQELLLLVCDVDPISPRLLNPSVPRDLETICLKCLQKDPARRYATAQELADELGRFLDGEPIHARPVGRPEKLWRWAQRKPLLASLLLLVNLIGAVAIGGILWQWQRAEQNAAAERFQRDNAQAANRELARTISVLELQRAENLFRAGDAASAVAHLTALLRRDPASRVAANRLISALVHRDWALPATLPLWHSNRVNTAFFNPAGDRVLSASWDRTAKIWDSGTGQILASLQHNGPVSCARFSPDGRSIVTASVHEVRIWDAASGQARSEILRHKGRVNWTEFSGNGELLATASDDGIARVWTARGTRLRELISDGSPVRQARFSPNGRLLAIGTESGAVRVWNVETGELAFKGQDTYGRIESLTFSPDGRWLAAACADRFVHFWISEMGQESRLALAQSASKPSIWHVAFSADSRFILTASEDGTGRIWETETGRLVGEPLRHESGVTFGEFSPDGKSVVTTSSDNTTRLWDALTGEPLCQPLRQLERVVHASFDLTGRRLLTASYDSVVQIWNLEARRILPWQARHDAPVNSVVFEPQGARVLTASDDGTARVWDASTAAILSLNHPDAVRFAAFSADGRRIITACADGIARVWETLAHQKAIWSAQFSPEGTQIATASADGTARIWEVNTGRAVTPPLRHAKEVWIAGFSPDGRSIATASDDFSARVWNARSGDPITGPLTHLDHVKWVEFSPDGRRLLSASSDNTARIFEVPSGKLLTVLRHPRSVSHAIFSPDGRRIATASLDRSAQIWDAATGQALTPPLKHDSPLSEVHFSSDGNRILTLCWNGTTRLWDPSSGQPLTAPLTSEEVFRAAVLDHTGSRLALAGDKGSIRIWDLPIAPIPVPEWFLDFAEAVAGIHLTSRGNIELVQRDDFARRFQLSNNAPADFYSRIAFWFISPPGQRPSL